MGNKIDKFIEVRKSILDDMQPNHPDWKHHVSFLKLAEAVKADSEVLSKPSERTDSLTKASQ